MANLFADVKKKLKGIFGIPCQVCKKAYATTRSGHCRTIYLCKDCEENYKKEQKK